MAEDSIFSQAGFELPKAASKEADIKTVPKSSSMFEAAGFSVPGSKTTYVPPADSEYPSPEKFAATPRGEPEKSTLQKIHEAIDPATLLKTGASNAVHDTVENFVASKSLAGQGVSDLRQGNYLPSAPSINPTTWSPGGVLKTAGGVLGMAASPVTGATNALVGTPVTELTGNPDIGDRASFVASSLLPIKGGGKVAEAAAPSTKAINGLVEAVGAKNVPELVAGMRANPRMTPADLSDPVRVTTQGLMAGGTPDVQNFISGAVRDRAGSRLQAANTAFTDTMGPSPDVPKMVEGLKQRASDIGKSVIDPAVKGAKPVDVTPVIQAIDKEIASDPVGKATLRSLKNGEEPNFPLSDYQRRLFELRQDLRGSWKDRDQMFLDAGGEQGAHWLQAGLRSEAQNLLNSASGAERNLGGKLMDMRNKIVDQIDEAAGGAYKPALSKFRDVKQIDEAFESGFDTLKNRSGLSGALEDSPQAFRNWMKDATPEEVVARRLGTRADIDQKINSVKNGALKGETITQIPYNQEKLTALFGDKEAGRLIRVMKDAQREAQTNAAIMSGSKTAETTAAAERIKVRDVKSGNPLQYAVPFMSEFLGSQYGVPGVGAAMLGLKGAHLGVQKVGQIADKARNMEFAKNALATGPAREETINRLLAHPQVVRELKKRSNALTTP